MKSPLTRWCLSPPLIDVPSVGRSSDFAADHRAPVTTVFAVENVKRVGFFVMNFHLTGCRASIYGDERLWRHQSSAFGDLFVIDISDC